MAKKLKYHLDHPQIKRNKSWGNDSKPGDKPGQSAGGFIAGVKSLFTGGSKSESTEPKTKPSKTSFASNSGGAAKASSGFGALISGKPKK